MKIPPIGRIGAIDAYKSLRVRGASETGAPIRPDAVEISADAASFGDTFRAVMKAMDQGASPELRAQREAAAAQVKSGTYQVEPDQVAAAILRGVRLDKEV